MIAETGSRTVTCDRALISGAWRGSTSGAEIEVRNPATDQLIRLQ